MVKPLFSLVTLSLLTTAALAEPTPPVAPVAAPEATTPEPKKERISAHTAQLTVQVVHLDQVRRGLEDAARALGGHPTVITRDLLVLRVPPAKLNDFLAEVAKAGLVIEKSASREDLTEQIAQLEGQLASKNTVFARLKAFIEGSDLAATLEVEQAQRQLVEQMEAIQGSLRALKSRAALATVNVSFRFRERQPILSVSSPFPWINSVDLDQFIVRFEEEEE